MVELIIVYAGIAVLAPLVFILEPAPRLRRLDVAYWLLVTPLVTGVLTRATALGAIGLLSATLSRHELSLHLVYQLPLALLLADFAGYWSHRARHVFVLWHFHAIHHSATQLDALAAARMHPIDDVIDNTIVGLSLFVCGFSLEAILLVSPILFLHTALTHLDVAWDFGPLRKLLVSPAHHRAHHEVGARHNYAGMFSLFDVVFGTYAETTGAPHGSGEPLEEGLWSHLTWPVRVLLPKR